MYETALRLACKELGKNPETSFEVPRCPYHDFNICVSDIHPVICNDIREKCWFKYFVNKANENNEFEDNYDWDDIYPNKDKEY